MAGSDTKQRRQIQRLLRDNPSLKPVAALQEVYQDRILVVGETPLSETDLPAQSPSA